MKTKIYLFLSFCAMLLSVKYTTAQCGARYRDKIFTTVTPHSNVTYTTANGVTLKMDIFEPANDTAALRPLIVMAHGGSFTSGDRTSDNVVNYFCSNYAKRGYVTASIDYRLETNVFNMLDSAKAINEVLKALSDGKSAVRYLRKEAPTYRIDTSHIFVGGNSAGAVLFAHYIYLDSLEEAPAYLQTVINNNGGFEGNSGNDGYPSNVHALINLAGGLNVAEFIGPGSKPSFNAQGTADQTVPYNCGYPNIGFGVIVPVRLCGLGAFEPLYQQYQTNHVSIVYQGEGHVPWATNTAELVEIDTTCANFLAGLLCGTSTAVHEITGQNNVTLFPNPAGEFATIQFGEISGLDKIQLLDMNGKVVYEHPVNSASMTIEKNHLSAGMYLLRAVSKDGSSSLKKLIFE